MGIEPMTSSLPRKCSTAELSRLFSSQFSAASYSNCKPSIANYSTYLRAEDEVRTRDL